MSRVQLIVRDNDATVKECECCVCVGALSLYLEVNSALVSKSLLIFSMILPTLGLICKIEKWA